MVKTEKRVAYSDTLRFDADFKKRQSEIQSEITAWSQSEAFRENVQNVVNTKLNDHNVLIDLSRRFFENGSFLSKFKELTKKEIETNKHYKLIERGSKIFWIILASFFTVLGYYLREYFRK